MINPNHKILMFATATYLCLYFIALLSLEVVVKAGPAVHLCTTNELSVYKLEKSSGFSSSCQTCLIIEGIRIRGDLGTQHDNWKVMR